MKLSLNEIPEEGLTLSEKFSPGEMGLQMPGLKFLSPVEVTAAFLKEQDLVVVNVEARGEQELLCGRCLEAVKSPYEGRFDLSYEVKGKFALDVTDDIRQEILLSFPLKPLCKEGCRGLCPACGNNLNHSPCQCKR
ncbi:MAG: DUF177 domain-containing protein [Candidatus Omnitrophica bacterium]|nr:DUF177 domain-containing protein [Candidatus Omnitrophota bacterium]